MLALLFQIRLEGPMFRGCKSLSSGLAGESEGPACGELACTGTVRVVARIASYIYKLQLEIYL